MAATPPPLVLVADDEPSMLELVARHLTLMSEPKLEVIQASDGEEAWRLAREHLPDLVVLDVMMPGMSGWEVCRKIREDVALAHTGVVMLTGIGENLNQMTSPLYGADAYIDKPFEFEDFDGKVRETLRSREKQRLAVVRPSVNGTSGVAKPAKAGGTGKRPASGKKAKGAKASPKKASPKKVAASKKASPKKVAASKKPASKKKTQAVKKAKTTPKPKKATKKAAPKKKTTKTAKRPGKAKKK